MDGFDIPLDDIAADAEEELDVDEETSFIDPPIDVEQAEGLASDGATLPSLRRELLQTTVDDYYAALADKGLLPAFGRDVSNFELTSDWKLRLKAFPGIDIVDRYGRPLALSTIAGRRGGSAAIRDGLGFVDWSARRKLPSATQQALSKVDDEAAAAALASPADIDERINSLIDVVDAAAQTTQTLPTDPLPLKELLGLDAALKTLRGTKAVQESRIVSLQQLIEGYREDLERPGTTERADQIEREIQKAEDQLAAARDSIDTHNQQLRSQVRQIRETISSVLDKNKPLAERLRILFREQGVTIASILTAIGLAISTLVLALTGGGAGVPAAPVAPTPPPPADKGGLKEWAKKHLQALGRMLAQLAGKAAAALPGLIGGIVSWLLNLVSKTVGWFVENLWTLVVAIGGLLLVFAREWL